MVNMITFIEGIEADKKIKISDAIIEKYRELLPEEFFKLIEIRNNVNYMQQKSKNYQDLSIGIDPKISIGVEIEANSRFGFKFTIKQQNGYEKYSNESEASVPDGIEIATPPFHDKPEDVSKLCALLEAMKEMGYYYKDVEEANAAGQINIGLDYLDTARAVINFYEIFGNCEELLFHISNKVGQVTRQAIYVNSRFKPISEIINTRIIDEDITRAEILRMLYAPMSSKNSKLIDGRLQYKKNTVCIRDLESKNSARLEIRIPNGSTEYRVWLDNIRLYGKIVEVSKRLADIMSKDEISEEEERLLWLKEDLADPRNTLEDKLYTLMDLLFEDDEIKQIYINRFNILQKKIKETGTNKYADSPSRMDPAFGIVAFRKVYKDWREKDRRVISYDPTKGEYIDTDEKSNN